MYKIFEQLLTKNNTSAYQVSKATGISSQVLSKWKLGQSQPKLDKLQVIAEYFGVSLDYLTTGKEPEIKKSPGKILSEDERKLIELFNRVPEDKRGLVISMIETALKNL